MDTRDSDAVRKDEIFRNRREITHPTFGKLLLRRPTPRDEAEIANIRGKEYHKLIMDDTILSQAELEKKAKARGIWTDEDEQKRSELQEALTNVLGIVEALGYRTPEKIYDEYTKTILELENLLKDNPEATAAIAEYANLETIPASKLKSVILNAASTTEVDDLLDTVETIRSQITMLNEYMKIRDSLLQINSKYSGVFADALENRVSRIETLAKIYYCVRKDNGAPIWPSFSNIWDASSEEIGFLVDEVFCFEHGMTEQHKELMQKYGFMQRVTGDTELSAESPDPEMSSLDGESLEKLLPASSLT